MQPNINIIRCANGRSTSEAAIKTNRNINTDKKSGYLK
jgi:hypothetical protein